MMKLLLGALAGIALLIGAVYHSHAQPTVGSFGPTGGGTYRLGQSIGTSDSTIKLSSFKEPVSNIKYTMSYLNSDVEYGTLSPQSSISEFVSFTGITQNTDGSATLTGVTRGLTRTPAGANCTASTTLAQPHAGQSVFILSNSPCFYAEFIPARTNATSSAILAFSSTTPPRYDSPAAQGTGTYIATTSEFASIAYVNAISLSGVANATQAVKGIIQLPTARQAASSTALGGTGASMVLTTAMATDTPQNCSISGTLSGGCVVMSDLGAHIKQAWLDLSAAFTWTGQQTFSATTTIAASSTTTAPIVLHSLGYAFPSTRGASSTVLSEDGSGTLTYENAPWIEIGRQTISAAATTTLTLAATSTATNLRLVVYIHGVSSGSPGIALQLNPNTSAGVGTNYGYNTCADGASCTQVNSTNLFRNAVGGIGADAYAIYDISNTASFRKLVLWRTVEADASTISDNFEGSGLFNDTTNQIKSVAVGCTLTGTACTFTDGTIIMYASNR